MSYTRHNGCIVDEETAPARSSGASRDRTRSDSNGNADQPPTRVFLVDDHEIVRRGLIRLFQTDPELLVVGEAGSVAGALNSIPAAAADVAVLDVQLPDGSGLELCRELRARHPDLKCLMLTSTKSDQATLDAIHAGASGFVVKDIRSSTLARAIKEVGNGKSLFDPTAATELTERLQAEAIRANPLAALSKQEKAVLELLGQGLTNKEIASEMGLAEKTVKNYISRLFMKLGMERRIQAAVLVSNLNQPGPPVPANQTY